MKIIFFLALLAIAFAKDKNYDGEDKLIDEILDGYCKVKIKINDF